MEKIILDKNLGKVISLTRDKKIVLVGGCFDILHAGHLKFLEASKRQGDVLMVLLESDDKIKKIKGYKRPINNISLRAKALSAIESVDFVVLLSGMTKNEEYDKLIVQIRPSVIALTKGDANKEFRTAQAKKVGAKVVEVIERIEEISTTKLLNEYGKNLNSF